MDYRVLIQEVAQRPAPWDLGKQLRPLLASDSPLLYSLAAVVKQAQDFAWAMQSDDLVTDEGRAQALKRQGVIQGLTLAIDTILAPLGEFEDEA